MDQDSKCLSFDELPSINMYMSMCVFLNSVRLVIYIFYNTSFRKFSENVL